jgi:hypothetical protein
MAQQRGDDKAPEPVLFGQPAKQEEQARGFEGAPPDRQSDSALAGSARHPQVTVCVIAYNSGPTLRTCLERLGAQTFRDFETLVIDNASPDPGDAAIAAEFPWVRLIRNDSNLGFTGAGNQGAREGRGRWYVLLNPDAYAEPDWLAKLVAAAERHPKVKSFTSRQMVEGEPGVLDGLGDVMSITGIPYRGGYLNPDDGQAREGEVFSPCGAAMMIDQRLFLDLGGFDEDFFCYGEDVDLGYRLQLAGQPTLLVPGRHHPPCGVGFVGRAQVGVRGLPRHAQPLLGAVQEHACPTAAAGRAAAPDGAGADLPEEGQPAAHPADPARREGRLRRGAADVPQPGRGAAPAQGLAGPGGRRHDVEPEGPVAPPARDPPAQGASLAHSMQRGA